MLSMVLAAAVILPVAAQISLKLGVRAVGGIGFGLKHGAWLADLLRILRTPYFYLGFGLYGVSSILMLVVLSHFSLAYANLVLSLTYVVVLVASMLFFGERLTSVKWLGALMICAGVALVTR